jgi:competence protein ComK
MMGEYDRYGKLCARVIAGRISFLVDRTPQQLLDDTLTSIGFDLRGAMAGAKFILGKKMKCPIIVNPYLGICLFPSKSPNQVDCMWFNPEQILKTTEIGDKTKVYFRNGYSIIIDSKLAHFNNKIQTANQLLQISAERGHHPSPIILLLEPKKELEIPQEKNGKYNFDALEEE